MPSSTAGNTAVTNPGFRFGKILDITINHGTVSKGEAFVVMASQPN